MRPDDRRCLAQLDAYGVMHSGTFWHHMQLLTISPARVDTLVRTGLIRREDTATATTYYLTLDGETALHA